jgi:hypothetical protein
MRLGIAILLATIGVANADVRPSLEQFTSSAPTWAKDCRVDLVAIGENAFSVAIACRGSEELVFERRAKQAGPKSGSVTSFDGSTRVLVWRTSKYATDVYSCTSTADADPAARCKALVDAVMQSTIARRGTAAFARPKS